MQFNPTILTCGIINENDSHSIVKIVDYINQELNEEHVIVDILEGGIENNLKGCITSIGNYYYKKNQYDLMIKYYQHGITLNIPECYYNLGVYYEDVQKNDLMLKNYLKASQMGIKEAFANLSVYYYERNDMTNTLKYLREGIKFQSHHCYNNLAIYYHVVENNKNKSKELYDKALNVKDTPIIRLNYSKMLYYFKDNTYKDQLLLSFDVEDSVDFLNQTLSSSFDSILALKTYNYLNQTNKDKLHSLINK